MKNSLKIILAGVIALGVQFGSFTYAADKASDAKKVEALPDHVKVQVDTSMGKFELDLDHQNAPKSVENFLKYAEDGFYNGTIFHRVIDNFMIQGGGFTKEMKQKDTRAPIPNEANNGLRNDNGTVAMARTPAKDSATAQFFINVKDNDFLNHRGNDDQSYGYAVFGKVTKGMDVITKIKAAKTTTVGAYRDVPVDPIVIKKVTRLK